MASNYNKNLWAENLSELGIDHYLKTYFSCEISRDNLYYDHWWLLASLCICCWLPTCREMATRCQNILVRTPLRDIALRHKWLLGKFAKLLPSKKDALPCSFLLGLLKTANILNGIGKESCVQLEEATVTDLLILSLSYIGETLYNINIVITILEEFMPQGQRPLTSRPRGKFRYVHKVTIYRKYRIQGPRE